MPEQPIPPDDWIGRAFLYLSPEIESEDRIAFEERLAQDPRCQEALVAAVQLWPEQVWRNGPRPNPAIRDHVRARLSRIRHSRTIRDRFLPFAYALGGGLTAAFLLTLISPGRWLGPSQAPTLIVNQNPDPYPGETAIEAIYSDLSNNERLFKVRQIDGQRRLKQHGLKQHHPPQSPTPTPMNNHSMM